MLRKWCHKYKILLFILCIVLTGCYKKYLYVQQEHIGRDYLASSYVHTPDPRQQHPPKGRMIHINWDVPKTVFDQKLIIYLTVRFCDHHEEKHSFPLENQRGYKSFFFQNTEDCEERTVLTYLVKLSKENNEVIEVWKHQLWTDLPTKKEN